MPILSRRRLYQPRSIFDPQPAAGGNAVTFSAIGSGDTQAITAISFDGMIAVGSGLTNSGLIAVACVGGGTSAVSPTAIWDATGGPGPQANQSMTLLGNQDAGSGRQVMIFGLRNPSPGATNRFKLNWSAATISLTVNLILFTHVNPASDAAAFPNFTGSSTGATPDSITITTGLNNYAVAGYSSQANFSSVSDSQLFIDNTQNNWAVAANYKQSTGSTDTLTGSPGHVNSTIAGICIAHD